VGFGRRLARKAVRRSVPRPVRPAMHPVRTAKRAVTPRPVRQASHALYTITNPLGAAENKLINAAFGSGNHNRRRSNSTNSQGTRHTTPSQATRGTAAATGAGIRVAEATASHLHLAELMAVQKERFTPAQRPILAPPVPVDPAPFEQQEWARLKSGTHFWQRSPQAAPATGCPPRPVSRCRIDHTRPGPPPSAANPG
jgi:hypothetical protein